MLHKGSAAAAGAPEAASMQGQQEQVRLQEFHSSLIMLACFFVFSAPV